MVLCHPRAAISPTGTGAEDRSCKSGPIPQLELPKAAATVSGVVRSRRFPLHATSGDGLPNVHGKSVQAERFDNPDVQLGHEAGGRLFEEVKEERDDVFGVFAKWGYRHDQPREARVEVAPKPALHDSLGEVRLPRPNDQVDGYRPRPSERGHLSFLQHPQKLALLRPWQIGDLVEQQSSPVRSSYVPDTGLDGAGEGPFSMAKQFTFREFRQSGGTVHADELSRSPAPMVNRSCEPFLAHPAFSDDEDRQCAVSNAVRGQHRLSESPTAKQARSNGAERTDFVNSRGTCQHAYDVAESHDLPRIQAGTLDSTAVHEGPVRASEIPNDHRAPQLRDLCVPT